MVAFGTGVQSTALNQRIMEPFGSRSLPPTALGIG
jgi:hypothetical protein